MVPKRVEPRERLIRLTLIVTLVGLAQWAFGNIYEQVVLAPNFAFGDALAGLVAYRAFFRLSNPVYYYVPAGQITCIALFATLILAWRDERRRPLLASTACVLLAIFLSLYVITQINLRIFFGPLPTDPNLVMILAQRWFVLSLVRIALVITGFVFAARALQR